MTTASRMPHWPPKLRARHFLMLSAGVLVLPALVIALQSYRAERAGFSPHPHPPRKSLADFAVPGLRPVSFPSRGGDTLRGYYAPPKRRAAVVLTHGSTGERSDLLDEVRLLAEAGFGVLAFDWPGHGESAGTIEWGESERQALRGAIDWLAQNPEVDANRIGAFGFSMGGYILTQVAAGDLRLKAVAIAGTPHDPVEHTRWEYRRYGVLSQWPAFLAIRLAGMRLDDQIPEQMVPRIAPRPLLVVAGSDDHFVPTWMAEKLFRSAREPKELFVVQRANHGGYFTASPESYAAKLREFFGTLER